MTLTPKLICIPFLTLLFCLSGHLGAQPFSEKGKQLYEEAGSLAQKSQFEKANNILRQAIPTFEKEKNWKYYFGARISIFYNNYDGNKFEEANEQINEVIADFDKKEISEKYVLKLGDAYLGKGSLEKDLNRYEESLQSYFKAIDAYSSIDSGGIGFDAKEKLISFCHNNLGNTYLNMHQLPKAMEHLEIALKLKEKVLGRTHQSTLNTLRLIGETYQQLGYLNKSLEYETEVLKAEQEQGEIDGVAHCYRNFSKIYQHKLDFKTAEEYARKAITIYDTLKSRKIQKIGFSYHQLGNVLKDGGKYNESIPWFEKAIANFDEVKGKGSFNAALSTMNIGKAYTYLKEYERGLIWYKKAEKLFRKNVADDNPRYVELWLSMGCNYEENGNFSEANRLFKKSYDLAKATQAERNFDRGQACKYWARTIEDVEEALAICQEGLREFTHEFEYKTISENPLSDDIYHSTYGLEILELKTDLFFKKYEQTGETENLEFALQTIRTASDLIDQTRQSYLTESAKTGIAERARSVYEKGVKIAFLLKNRNALAFRFMEKSRSLVLLESLQSEAAQAIAKIPDSLAFQKQKLREQILDLETRFASLEIESAEAQRMNNEIFALKDDSRNLNARIKTEFPAVAEMDENLEEISLSDVQSQLLDNELIIEYLLTDDQLFVLKISSDKVENFEVPFGEKEKATTVDFIKMTKDNRLARERGNDPELVREFADLSYSIFEKTLAFALDGSEEKLIVIPDLYFNYLPFELLLTEQTTDSEKRNFSNLSYLLKKYPIRYSFSSNLLFQKFQNKQSTGTKLLAYAPKYEGTSNPIFATRAGFTALSQTKKEVEKIINFLGGIARTDEEASEAFFKKEAANYGLLHLAMHAYTDEGNPMLSGLIFTENGDEEDDILRSYELYGMKLNAQLAVLSACNTGSGKLAKGEGVMSLARGFRMAGVPNIVMSLWQVDDESTRMIMENFYANLKNGQGKDEALQQAKLDFLKTGSKTFPHYWGAFVLMGDDAPLQFDGFSNSGWIWIGLALALCLLGYFKFYDRRTNN